MRRLLLPAILACTLVPVAAHGDSLSGSGITANADFSASPVGPPSKGKTPVRLTAGINLPAQAGQKHALSGMELKFDPRLKVTTTGLPTCNANDVAGKVPTQARRICGNALIGTGSQVVEYIYPESPPFDQPMELLFFNAAGGGKPRIVIYLFGKGPEAPFAIATTNSLFEYATGKLGGIMKSINFRLGKSWSYRGKRYSYLSGPCGGSLSTKVSMDLNPGKINLSGSVPTRCG
jgi:hypothetical protein